MKTDCPGCDRWYDLPTKPGRYACETCGREYRILRTSAPPAVTYPCPGCEAAARERDGLKDELTNLRIEVDRMVASPIICACGDHIGYAEEIGLSQDGVACGNCAVGRKDYDARTELATLRAGILRVIEDYPRDIKQDAEEALRALVAGTVAPVSGDSDLRARLAALLSARTPPYISEIECNAYARGRADVLEEIRALLAETEAK